MKLIKGKFYEGDKELPVEFGNKEQIKLMNDQLSLVNALNGDGLEVEPEIETVYRVSVSFTCPCGANAYANDMEIDDDNNLSAIKEMVGNKFNCHQCGNKYVCEENDDNELVVKLRK